MAIWRHARNSGAELAEVAVPKNLFREILRLIDGLRPKHRRIRPMLVAACAPARPTT